MWRYKKRVACLLLLIISIVSLTCISHAQNNRVWDFAKLLSKSQINEIESKIVDLNASSGMDFAIVTTKNTNGKSSVAFADDFYDQNGIGVGSDLSGAILLIDMQNRIVHISTSGKAVSIFTDYKINAIINLLSPYLSKGNYDIAIGLFISECKHYIETYTTSGSDEYSSNSTYSTGSSSKSISPGMVLIFVGISALIAFLTCLGVAKKYKANSVRDSYPVNEKSRTQMLQNNDILVNVTQTSRVIPKASSSSSGSSSTHSSSSGRTHGGGSGSF